jgi:hypothetical protein
MQRLPFPLADQVPDALRGVLLDFLWDTERLWQMDLPVTQLPIERLTWQLALPMWQVDDVPFQVSPAQVAAHPDRYATQHARTMAADTQYPLHAAWLNERPTVLDGMHRLLRAHLAGDTTVLVKFVPHGRFDEFARHVDPGQADLPEGRPRKLRELVAPASTRTVRPGVGQLVAHVDDSVCDPLAGVAADGAEPGSEDFAGFLCALRHAQPLLFAISAVVFVVPGNKLVDCREQVSIAGGIRM